MKKIARAVAFNCFSLFILTQLFSGIRILGGLPELIISGFMLGLLSFVLKPIFNILALPINAITFGTFSIVINAVVLYILTILVKYVQIQAFVWQGIRFAGFVIPRFTFNTIAAFLVISFMQTLVTKGIIWLT